MKIGWFCKHGQVSGNVEVQTHMTFAELNALVKRDHAKVCKVVGGIPWVLMNTEVPGAVSHGVSGNQGLHFHVDQPENGELLVLVHVQ